MLHGLVYERDDSFYDQNLHNSRRALGTFCSGGTIANISALWVARNQLFRPSGSFGGIAKEGLARSLKHKGYEDVAIVVSERGHYSLGKAADVLGIGRENVISIKTDENHKVDVDEMRKKCAELTANNIGIVAIVGIAGATETGQVDPRKVG